MKLIAQVQLKTSPEQTRSLRDTLKRANAAANAISDYAWVHETFRTFALHRALYYDIKARFDLTAQVVIRSLSKVSDAYKLDKRTKRNFRPLGAIAYDDRILRWYSDSVSIWTVDGRQRISFVCGERQRLMLATRQGESDLVYQDGRFYLLATCNIEAPPPGTPDDWLGVDLGVVNIATTSDGDAMSGAAVNGLRHRHRRLRRKLQVKGTRGARRLLHRRSRKESRFARHINHEISKRIVATAKGTGRGIALENLKGIRERVSARKPQRAALHSWSFGQLRTHIEYKARRAGVMVALVDPRNTSRTCPSCGHCEKGNRQTQSQFLCRSCNFSGLADHIAAIIIGRRAECNAAILPELVAPGQSCLP